MDNKLKSLCCITIWFKLYFDYFIHTIQENYIQFIQDLTISRRLVLTSFSYNHLILIGVRGIGRGYIQAKPTSDPLTHMYVYISSSWKTQLFRAKTKPHINCGVTS